MIEAWKPRGFTLIEMLIAMTLLGILVALLFSSMRVAAESWNAGEGKIVEVNRKAVVYQFFKRHLSTIRPLPAPDSAQNPENGFTPQQAFQGQRQMLRFAAALPAAAARKGMQMFEIGADQRNPARLMVALSPYQQSETGQPERVALLDGVQGFAFSYFGKKEDSGEALWQDDWSGIDRLPQLIKVSINLNDGSYWPEMVFAVKITGQVNFGAVGAENAPPPT